jgi:cell wall-associated NlpC family hydrolase
MDKGIIRMNRYRVHKMVLCLAATAIAVILFESPAYAEVVNNKTVQSFFVSTNKKKSEFADVGISIANNFVNIRKKPNKQCDIIGKLYKGHAVTITAAKGNWVKVEFNGLKGYIKSEYLAIGHDAEKLTDKYGIKYATVNVRKLNVRSKMSTKSTVLTSLSKGTDCQVKKEMKKWVKIVACNKITGYVASQYVDIKVKLEGADSIEKEQKPAEEDNTNAQENIDLTTQVKISETNAEDVETKAVELSENETAVTEAEVSVVETAVAQAEVNDLPMMSDSSAQGSEIVAYALQFVGNPYVWGGISLTMGADCSGFVMSVYNNFGYRLNRTSRDQALQGISVSIDQMQPGDLVFYANNGIVNHVAIYIGNEQIVHACNKNTGVIVSSIYYNTPYCVKRILE